MDIFQTATDMVSKWWWYCDDDNDDGDDSDCVSLLIDGMSVRTMMSEDIRSPSD